jgi:antirestriction protein ArdC
MTKLYRKSASTSEPRVSVYDKVTQAIIEQLEKGIAPWSRPWGKGNVAPVMPMNAVSSRRYTGVNVLILWGTMIERGYSSPFFLTFKQAQELGGSVMKGEKATVVYYADKFIPREERAKAEAEGREAHSIYFMKSFCVFNVEQCEGLPADFYAKEEAPSLTEQHAVGEALIRASGADYRIGGDRAYYSPAADYVRVPPQPAFHEPINYYRTAFHELSHWTGHGSRLHRDQSGSFGSKPYAQEELVAEMGAAFLCASLGIQPTVRHADYIGSWLEVLRSDNRAIFKAASQASRAADYLLARLEAAPPPDPDKAPVPETVEPVVEPVELPAPMADPEPVGALPVPVAAPLEPVEPIGIPECQRRRSAAFKAGIAAFEAGKARVMFGYVLATGDRSTEAREGWFAGFDYARENASKERAQLARDCPLLGFDFEPVREPMPDPLGEEAPRTITRDGVPCRVWSLPESEATKEIKRRLRLAMSGQDAGDALDWTPPGFTYTPPASVEAKLPPRVIVTPTPCREALDYYKGGHRFVVGGVPCRIARKPRTRHHADMIRESLRALA